MNAHNGDAYLFMSKTRRTVALSQSLDNATEHAIRPCTVHRKNAVSYGSEDGVKEDGSNSHERILKALEFYGIYDNKVVLWGTGNPLREFLWSEDMADASVHVLLNVDFKDIIGIEKYSSVFFGAKADGAVDRNNSEGRGGAIPSLGEIRNCHINVGTGKELTIRELSELVVKAVGFEGTVEFDSSKPDGTVSTQIRAIF